MNLRDRRQTEGGGMSFLPIRRLFSFLLMGTIWLISLPFILFICAWQAFKKDGGV